LGSNTNEIESKEMIKTLKLTSEFLSVQQFGLKHITLSHAVIYFQGSQNFPRNKKKGWNSAKRGKGMKLNLWLG
jgi:hypothetical protein